MNWQTRIRILLVKLAQDKAVPENSYAPLQQQLDTLATQLNLLKERVAAIEGSLNPVRNILNISSRKAHMMPTITAIK